MDQFYVVDGPAYARISEARATRISLDPRDTRTVVKGLTAAKRVAAKSTDSLELTRPYTCCGGKLGHAPSCPRR